jgi:hypothetical protein
MLHPLTRMKPDGHPYVRRPVTTAILLDLVGLGRDEILVRLSVSSRAAAGYVPSECLVYLLRAARRDNSQAWFNRLFGILDCRLKHGLAHAIRQGSVSDTESVREEVRARFFEILARGLGPEPDRLDPFEVMFDGALAALRKDMYGAQRRQDSRKADLAVPGGEPDDDGPGAGTELAQPEAESPFGLNAVEFGIFRERALGSIDGLPDDQREAIALWLDDMKIDSKDPAEMTIAKRLGVTEKTVRNRIARGVEAIRAKLEGAI